MKNSNHHEKWMQWTTLLLAFFLYGTTAFAQADRIVMGIVTDEFGEPLPAAYVSEISKSKDGKPAETVTDVNGHFTLKVRSTTTEVKVIFLGYEDKFVTLTSDDSYEIQLVPSVEILDEVMVTGYQSISRERATGAFASVGDSEMEHVRLNSLDNLLEGRVAGYNNGKIRGVTSMNGMTTPLYVVDGFPIENTRYTNGGWDIEEDLPFINMEDIETITVLKDAAATSIYGSRAANGVIVITTKKGSQSNTGVTFSTSLTYSPYSYYTDNIADAETMIGIEREWAQSNPYLQGPNAASYAESMLSNAVYSSRGIRTLLQGYSGALSKEEVDRLLDDMAAQGYRYYDEMGKYAKRDKFYQQYNIGFSKSTNSNTLNASITYKNNKYEDKYTDDQSIGVNIQNSARLTKWLTLDLGTYLNYGTNTTQTYSVLSPGYNFMPYDYLMNDDGTHYTSLASDRNSDSFMETLDYFGLYNMDITPLDEIALNHKKGKELATRIYGKLGIEFAPWLRYNAMFQYEYGSYRVEQLKDKGSYEMRNKFNSYATENEWGEVIYNLPYGHQFYTEDQYTNAYNFRQQLDFQKTFNDKHELTIIAGTETRHSKVEFTSNNLYNYDPDMLTYTPVDGVLLHDVYGLVDGAYWKPDYDLTKKSEIVNRFVSIYGNAGYTYDNRYTVTGSIRWDRSNLWGTDSKYQNKPLWSVGAAWNIHNETLFTVPNWIDMLKLRFSYGIGGNIAKDSAPYMTATYSPNYNVGGNMGMITRRPNPELSWEMTATTNVGVDFAFFGGRLDGTIDFYNKQGKDLLANTTGVPVEGFGYSTYTINNGEMVNRGVELALAGDIIRTRNFRWNASLLYGYNYNEVTYVNVEALDYYLLLDYPEAYPRIGNPYNAIYAYKWAGLSEDGLPQVYDEYGEVSVYDPASLDALEYAGTTVPVHTGSFGSTFSYKGFELSFLVVFEAGHKMRNTFLPFFDSDYSWATGSTILTLDKPINADIENRWQKPGDEAHTNIPRIVYAESDDYLYDSYSVYKYADINVLDASNIRLSNVSLAYHLPKKACNKLRIYGARIQFNIENLYTFAMSRDAKYLLEGFNPPNYVLGLHLEF